MSFTGRGLAYVESVVVGAGKVFAVGRNGCRREGSFRGVAGELGFSVGVGCLVEEPIQSKANCKYERKRRGVNRDSESGEVPRSRRQPLLPSRWLRFGRGARRDWVVVLRNFGGKTIADAGNGKDKARTVLAITEGLAQKKDVLTEVPLL